MFAKIATRSTREAKKHKKRQRAGKHTKPPVKLLRSNKIDNLYNKKV